MYIPEKPALLSRREQFPDQKTQTAIGFTVPIIVVVALALGYLYWRRKKNMESSRRRRRRSRRSRHDSSSGPIVSANGFIQGDVWDDGGGFDPDPRRRTAETGGVGSGDGFIRGDVWDSGGGFDPDPRRRSTGGPGHGSHGTETLLDDVWNDGESDGHVDVHPSRRQQRHSTRPRRRSTDDGHRRRRTRRRRSTGDGRRDRDGRIEGDVWNDGDSRGHVDRDPNGRAREPSIAHSVTGNSHIFGTDDIDDRSFRTATDRVDEGSEMPTFPVRAHRPVAPANVAWEQDDDLFSEVDSARGREEDNRIAEELRRALQGHGVHVAGR